MRGGPQVDEFLLYLYLYLYLYLLFLSLGRWRFRKLLFFGGFHESLVTGTHCIIS